MGAKWEPGRTRRRRAVRTMRERHQRGETGWGNLCQKAVRTALGAGPGAASARIAWLTTPAAHKRPWRGGKKTPPFGVPVYFKLDSPYWHAALSAGRGYVWSNDIIKRGRIHKVSIAKIEQRWNAEYLGWTTHINGRRIW